MTGKLSVQTVLFEYHGQKYKVFLACDKRHVGCNELNPLYFLDANRHFETLIKAGYHGDDVSPVLYIGIGYQEGVDIKEAAIKWSADPNMTLQSIFIDVLWLNFPIFSQKSALCC